MSVWGPVLRGAVQGYVQSGGSWYGAAAGAVQGYESDRQERSRQAAAQKQMDFQEYMSSTSYQRAVRDMTAAGLNPMLGYSQGGASSPGGSGLDTSVDRGTAVSSAVSASTMQEMTRKNMELADLNKLQVVQQTAESAARTLLTSREADEVIARMGTHGALTNLRGAEEAKVRAETGRTYGLMANDAETLRQIQTMIRRMAGEIEGQALSNSVQRYRMVKEKNDSEANDSYWGREVRPYLSDAESVGRIGASAMDIGLSLKRWGGKSVPRIPTDARRDPYIPGGWVSRDGRSAGGSVR